MFVQNFRESASERILVNRSTFAKVMIKTQKSHVLLGASNLMGQGRHVGGEGTSIPMSTPIFRE